MFADLKLVLRSYTSLYGIFMSASLTLYIYSGNLFTDVYYCVLPGFGTYHFSPILLPTRKSGTIRHLENGGNQNFTEAFVTLIVTM